MTPDEIDTIKHKVARVARVTDGCRNLPRTWVAVYLRTVIPCRSRWPQIRGGVFAGTHRGFRSFDGFNSYERIAQMWGCHETKTVR